MADDIARASITVDATRDEVWHALTDPATIEKYYFGTVVTTDWQPGSAISWSSEFEGRQYEDHGEILEAEPPRRLRHTHFSPLAGKPDEPENYHTLTYTLASVSEGTEVTLEQDNNGTPEAAQHAARNWRVMLEGLKATVEG